MRPKVDPVLWTRQPLCVEQCGAVFVWRHVAEAFLVSAISIVVYVVGDGGFDLLVVGVFVEWDFLFHFAEEGFAGCIVPAVAFSRHGLDEAHGLYGFTEFFCCVVNALVGVDDGVLAVAAGVELFEGLEDEVEAVACAGFVGDGFVGLSVDDDGDVGEVALVFDVGDVGEEEFSCFAGLEGALDAVGCDFAFLAVVFPFVVGPCFFHRAFELIFPHDALDFFAVVDDVVVVFQDHVKGAAAFVVIFAAMVIGFLYEVQGFSICFFSSLPVFFAGFVVVVSASWQLKIFAKGFNIDGCSVGLDGFFYDLTKISRSIGLLVASPPS